jgi:hypothetical protein
VSHGSAGAPHIYIYAYPAVAWGAIDMMDAFLERVSASQRHASPFWRRSSHSLERSSAGSSPSSVLRSLRDPALQRVRDEMFVWLCNVGVEPDASEI